jgi:hypothetical protein
MKKSKKMYRVAFAIGLILTPFVAISTPDSNFWFSGTMLVMLLIMFSLTFYAIRLEEHDQ